ENLDEDALAAAAVELEVEDLFPGAEVELAVGDGDHDFAAHDLAFVVGIGVVLAGAVVEIAAATGVGAGVEGSQALEPALVVLVEAGFVVVDEDGGGDVHGVDETESVAHTG